MADAQRWAGASIKRYKAYAPAMLAANANVSTNNFPGIPETYLLPRLTIFTPTTT